MIPMWNYFVPVVNVTLYDIMCWFLIYSILGWFVESIYMSICNKKITNRGFVHGPICPIYGFGGVMIHFVVNPLSGNLIFMYLTGSIVATMFEFTTAILMIHLLGYVWWDYKNKPFNFKGILCLESTVAWGFYTIIEYYILSKFVFMFIPKIPVLVGKIFIIVVLLYYIVDMIYCLNKVKKGNIDIRDNNLMQFS